MSTIAWVVLLVVAVVVIAAVAWWAGQRRRSQRLQDRFGPEYQRTVESAGDRSRAERDLEARQERVEAFDIEPLDPAERQRFQERWRVTQALFVDDPAGAIDQADVLIGEVMRARGYPVGDFEQRAADVSVNHPQVVDHYRTAHRIAVQQRTEEADTESLRQAMVHYRALFADLLDTADDTTSPPAGPGESDAASSTAMPASRDDASLRPREASRRREAPDATIPERSQR